MTFPGRFDSLPKIGEYVQEAARKAGLNEAGIYAVEMAVDEACTNIIEHAYGGEGIGDIDCSIKVQKTKLTIILRDYGQAFDPASVPDPDLSSELEARRERGLGLFFIRKLMDEVFFDFDPADGNTLTMIKYRERSS